MYWDVLLPIYVAWVVSSDSVGMRELSAALWAKFVSFCFRLVCTKYTASTIALSHIGYIGYKYVNKVLCVRDHSSDCIASLFRLSVLDAASKETYHYDFHYVDWWVTSRVRSIWWMLVLCQTLVVSFPSQFVPFCAPCCPDLICGFCRLYPEI